MVKRKETNRVVFHHSLSDGGDVDTFRKWHMTMHGWEDIGYHFVILKDGTIQEGRKITMMGSHAQGKNKDSIGVCFVGDFFKNEPTEIQLKVAAGLYHGLCRAYSKTLDVDFHRDIINPCPGPKFDRKKFLQMCDECDPYRTLRIIKGEKNA